MCIPVTTSRNRLMEQGERVLTDSELLSIVLGNCKLGQTALEAVDNVLPRLIAITPKSVKGVGTAGACQVRAAIELGRRVIMSERMNGLSLLSPRDVVQLMAPRMEDLPVEEFHVLILNAQNKLERDLTITRGLLNCSLVHPREVFRQAVAEKAASIVLVHNHPSGDPTPSPDDRKITAQLVAAGAMLDIPVNDHVIIGSGKYTSFAEAGLL